MTTVFLALILLWCFLTVVNQFNLAFVSRLLRCDIFGLVPTWTFFAPNPGHTDARVLIRFRTGFEVTSWQELHLSGRLDQGRRLLHGFFNPQRRFDKLLFDFRNTLVVSNVSLSIVRTSSEYISILRMSEMAASKHDQDEVQFMLAETNYVYPTQFEIVLISDIHRIMKS